MVDDESIFKRLKYIFQIEMSLLDQKITKQTYLSDIMFDISVYRDFSNFVKQEFKVRLYVEKLTNEHITVQYVINMLKYNCK